MTPAVTVTWPGPGPCTLALSHATGFCKEVWWGVRDELRRSGFDGPITAWDFPGHGASARLTPPVDWWDFAEFAFRQVEQLARPRLGLGHSMGAAALAMAQVRHPGLFDRLVLVEPIVFRPPHRRQPDNPLSDVARRRKPFYPSREEAMSNFLEKPVFAGWNRRALEGYVAGGLTPVDGGFVMSCLPDDEAEVFTAASAHDLYEHLGSILCPTLVVAGETSDTHPPSYVDELVDRIGANARPLIIPGTSHFVPMERPDAIAKVVLEEARAVEVSGFEG